MRMLSPALPAGLALVAIAACQDQPLLTAVAPDGSAFATFNVGCDETALIQAINDANSTPGHDTLELTAGCTYILTEGLPVLTGALTINGTGATIRRSSEAATPEFRIFEIASGTLVSISSLTISGGRSEDGGGIWNEGDLTLTHSTVSGNSAGSAGGAEVSSGGGIYNAGGALTLTHSTISANSVTASQRSMGGGIYSAGGTVTLTHSTVSGNSGSASFFTSGGGIYSAGGTVTLTHSTVSGNSADGGGGIYNAGGALTLTNSTISGHSVSAAGGGIFNQGTLTLTHSTISRNSASTGGGIADFGTLTLRSSLIAQNQVSNPSSGFDIYASGSVTATYSLIGLGDGHPIGHGSNGNIVHILPEELELQIGGLADNGGPTQTHALLPGSVAIDHIPHGTDGCGTTITTDQRGYVRPFSGSCDIGAFEFGASPAPAGPVFGGFLPPVQGAPVWNSATAGANVPLAWSLGGDFGLNILAANSPSSRQIDCTTREPIGDSVIATTPRKSPLSYNALADQYLFNWQTERRWRGTCREFVLELAGGGGTHSAFFQFR